ncbi:alpha/beta hydrolase [Lacticaseibacillus paracasei]|uniref:alpha/beta hydrolase n=1 Tax=Lacticaseibacillus paracasei TaxID=1597 RepID=UPI004045967C
MINQKIFSEGMVEVVMIQGLGQSANIWQPIQRQLRLPSRMFDVFARLKSDDSMTLTTLNAKLTADLQKSETPVILCGLSLGAVLTLMQLVKPATKIIGAVVSAPQFQAPNRLLMKA